MLRSLLYAALAVIVCVAVAGAGLISRTTKTTSGTTEWVGGTIIEPSEMNAEFVVLFNVINGGLDNSNLSATAGITGGQIGDLTLTNTDISATAAILYSKMAQTAAQQDADIVDDYSTDADEQDNTSSPGTADSVTLATNLEEEIAQLRYKLEQLTVGTSATAVASGTGTDTNATWIDGPLRPGNLIYHGGFDAINNLSITADGDGWTRVLTPTTLAGVAITESEGQGSGNALLMIDTADALSGVSQSLDGLKADRRYLAVASVKDVTGTCRLVTTGADTNQLSVTSDDSGAWQVLSGIFETDSTPTNVVVKLVAVAASDECHWDNVGVFEINTNTAPHTGTIVVTDSITDTTTGITNTNVAAISGLDVTVTPPAPGCSVSVDAQVTADGTNPVSRWSCELFENATIVGKHAVDAANSNLMAESAILRYSSGNKTPGTALAYAVKCADRLGGTANDAVLACNLTTDVVTEGRCYLSVAMECPQ